MEKNSHYFYVVECKDGSFYAGYTIDIEKRLHAHNEGKGAKYTRARKPVLLLIAKEYSTKREAMQMEYQFKQLTRVQKEKFILKERENKYAAAKKL
ncbi:GIY-YIG nuclease family protein [Priestia iocasae]|uniref:Endonuclease n=1 Tax=Priestia iocasae TaxID=2291674 RepID=A0ABS2QZR3_9BACI|nr:GIY-YIG nuclease family protein [Metabacillus iocasae]MBM7704930.1 putative endonuclease [Metabacillus iocasae]